MINLTDTPENIIQFVTDKYPEIEQLLFNANIEVHKYKGSVQPYQAAILYFLAKEKSGGDFLEIGTGLGYSAYFLAKANPDGNITTLNPSDREVDIANGTFKSLGISNINIKRLNSDKWYTVSSDTYDFIFVDGDHSRANFDLNWIDRLNDGGIIIFHDYSEWERGVYNNLNAARNSLGEFTYFVKDTVNNYGMAGWKV